MTWFTRGRQEEWRGSQTLEFGANVGRGIPINAPWQAGNMQTEVEKGVQKTEKYVGTNI